jgi:hypothetical protein
MIINIAGREIDEDDEQAEALLMSAHRSVSVASQTPSSRSPISASIIS